MHAPRFRVLAALAILLAMAMRVEAQTTYDLLLKGGHVIDARNGIDGVMDVAVAGGKIAAVRARHRSGVRPSRSSTSAGLYVTPGLIDIHVHVFATTGVQWRLGGRQQRAAGRLQLPHRRHHDGRRRQLRAGATSRTSGARSSTASARASSPCSTSPASAC